MDFLFTGYRDPIFGLIILITAVLLIIVLSYFWGILLSKNKQKIIDKFFACRYSAKYTPSRHRPGFLNSYHRKIIPLFLIYSLAFLP